MASLTHEWRKSARSQGNCACVEVRLNGGTVEVRDTKDKDGPVLRFDPAAWSAFIADVATATNRGN
jgi:hypothetical protein